MGLFSKKETTKKLPWESLTSVEQLRELVKTTHEKPILLFKHSTRCGISAMALNSFESDWSSEKELCDIYYLDLLKHRDVSDEIAALTGVQHQSPQVIVLKGDEVVYDASHSSIDARKIESTLRKA